MEEQESPWERIKSVIEKFNNMDPCYEGSIPTDEIFYHKNQKLTTSSVTGMPMSMALLFFSRSM